MWKLTRWQVVAMVVGTLLYIPLMHTLIYIGSYIYPASFLLLLLGLFFGPWVGLVVGGIGTLIEVFVSVQAHLDLWVAWSPWDSISYDGINWGLIISFALMGFIAGLSLQHTQGRWNMPQTFIIVLIFGLLAITLCFAFYDIYIFITDHTLSLLTFDDGLFTGIFDYLFLVILFTCCCTIKPPQRAS